MAAGARGAAAWRWGPPPGLPQSGRPGPGAGRASFRILSGPSARRFMFDFAWSELLVIGVVALIVIKPKDLPKVLRTVGYWVRQARQVASEFQTSIEQMAREAELSDVKKEIEDAGRKLTAEVQQTFDPVEIEKKFN